MPNRYFSIDSAQSRAEVALYESVRDLPLICPHGHVDPRLFADPDYQFGSPVDLLIIPDHYIFRMLYSQGISVDELGIPRLDGIQSPRDHRKIWQTVCDNWHLFRATPTGIWVRDELADVFGINLKINAANADAIYDAIEDKLASDAFRPRALFERFNIEVLATTDAATSMLQHHQSIRESDWDGRIIPTFRPDSVVNIDQDGWRDNIDLLGDISGVEVRNYTTYIQALEHRRAFFKSMGATAADHAALTAYTESLCAADAEGDFPACVGR